MRQSSRNRFITALVMLFSLLFSQLALAAYDCPNLTVKPEPVMQMPLDEAGHAMPCSEIDKQSPNLCQAHGQSKAQALDLGGQNVVAPFIPMALVAELVAIDQPLPSSLDANPAFLRASSCTPPITIRHCRFLN
jgi:hypothetical protein